MKTEIPKRLERRRQILLAYYGASIETLSNMQEVIRQVTSSNAHLKLASGTEDGRAPYLLAIIYRAICETIDAHKLTQEHSRTTLMDRERGWQRLIENHYEYYPKERMSTTRSHALNDALNLVVLESDLFFKQMFLDSDERENHRRQAAYKAGGFCKRTFNRTAKFNTEVADAACGYIVALAEKYRELKDIGKVVTQVQNWTKGLNTSSRPFQIIPVSQVIDNRPT